MGANETTAVGEVQGVEIRQKKPTHRIGDKSCTMLKKNIHPIKMAHFMIRKPLMRKKTTSTKKKNRKNHLPLMFRNCERLQFARTMLKCFVYII